jgi:hypothetical protein
MQIEIKLTAFYSPGDERRLFQGFNEIDCIKQVEGVGRVLILDINLSRLSKEKLFELIALLWRYQIDIRPLRSLPERNKRFAWLAEPHFYWHASMFSMEKATDKDLAACPKK